jgi:flagellar biosynthesis protein
MTDGRKVQPQAVALRFEQKTEAAPKVVASGRGIVAQQIIEAAKAAGVDIVEDPDLIEVLAKIPLDEEIPAELFQAIAEILVFIYRLNGRYASLNGE